MNNLALEHILTVANEYDPAAGTGASMSAPAPHGCVDDGYADSDELSRWMDRMESIYV